MTTRTDASVLPLPTRTRCVLGPELLDLGVAPPQRVADRVRGRVDVEERGVRHRHRADRLGHERGGVSAGQLAWRAADARQPCALEPVEAEGAPIVASHIPRHEVPTATGRHELVRLDQATRLFAVAPAVLEADLLVVTTPEREDREGLGVDGRRATPLERCNVRVHGVHPATQAIRQHLLELDQRAQRRVLHPVDRRARRGAESDRDGDGFFVVEEERRKMGARGEAVPTGRSRGGVDRIAQRAESVDVVSQCAGAHVEALGELGARPEPVGLQQGEEQERPLRRVMLGHGFGLRR